MSGKASTAPPKLSWTTTRDDNDNLIHVESGEKLEWTVRHGAAGRSSCKRCKAEAAAKTSSGD